MSEQALKPAPSGTGSVAGLAATGTYPVLPDGKAAPADGKDLPKVEFEKPDIDRLVQELNTVSRSIGQPVRFGDARNSPVRRARLSTVARRESRDWHES